MDSLLSVFLFLLREFGVPFFFREFALGVGGFVLRFARRDLTVHARFDGCRILRVKSERAGEVNLRKADAGLVEGIERGPDLVEFDGEVAGVEIDADPAADDLRIGCIRQQALEKEQRLRRVFDMTERFGFQPEVEIVTGLRR